MTASPPAYPRLAERRTDRHALPCSSSGLHHIEPMLEFGLVYEQFELFDAVDRHHGDPFEVRAQELIVLVDVAVLEHKRAARLHPQEDLAGVVAQAAAVAAVEDDRPHRIAGA